MVVRDCLKREMVAVGPSVPASQALALMQEHGVRQLPVIDRLGRLAGVVDERDLRQPFGRARAGDREGDVLHSMTLSPHSIGGEAPIKDALTLLWSHDGLDVLPVVSGDRLEGIVTRHDLMQALSQSLNEPIERPFVPATVWDEQAPDPSLFLG